MPALPLEPLNGLLARSLRAAPAAIVSILLAGNVIAPAPSAAEPLTPEEQHGKQIYHEGTSPDGQPIFAYVGRNDVKVPGKLLVCTSCHGADGLGRPEGGVEPSIVTWSHLTKSYGHQHSNGRQHPAFDETTLGASIVGQVDPAGNLLDPAMPRYEMSAEDLAALIAYMKRLESDLDPGLSETTIAVGSILPSEGVFGPLGRAVAATLRAYFEEINAAGGIYGRRLELQVTDYLGDARSTAANARNFVEQGGAFAVVGAFTLGMEYELFETLEDAGVPQIGPITLFAGHDELVGDSTFFLLSGLSDQARALVDYAAQQLQAAPSSLAVVISQNEIYEDVARAIERQAGRHGWPKPSVIRVTAGPDAAARRVAELSNSGVEAVFYFGPADGLPAFAADAAARGWLPWLFLSGQIAGRQAFQLPAAFDGRLALAYPSLPSDQTRSGATEFRALRDKHRLPHEHPAVQINAYAAAKVFVEGLRRSGKALSRAALIRALEGLSDFQTGLTPAVSYAANRRVGALGAYVVSPDRRDGVPAPEPSWIALR